MATILRISEAAALALHTMALLAACPGRLLSVRELAAKLSASEAHLAKVLQRLSRAKLVRSARGPKGGFALARRADALTLLEVYEAIDGPLTKSTCLLGEPVCDEKACLLGGLVERVNRLTREYLGKTRLRAVAKSVRARRPTPRKGRPGRKQLYTFR